MTVSHHFPASLFERRTTGELDEELKGELKLLACYTVLNQLPHSGVAEALDTLSEMLRFYQDRPKTVPQLSTARRNVVVTSVSTRPEFTLEGEK
jgi:hypothetical protein